MKKIILVDGNNLLFRSYYATAYTGNVMKNSKGFPTNGLYGFINMMNKIIREEKPNYILVAFDKGKTFRHDKYDVYKAGRQAMPDELRVQFPVAKEILGAMGIKYFEIDNYEADDIIGTMSKIVDEEDEFIATIVSSDKDLLQLISDEVTVKLLKSNDHIMMTPEVFRETYKCDPIKMIDLKALMGDSSDNIPGVKGIGEKTAINLIEKFGSLKNLYDNIDQVTGKTKDKLLEDKDNAFMSYDIATIYREVPIPFTLDDCKYEGINREELFKQLEELEMPSLIRKYDLYDESLKEKEVVEEKPLVIDDICNLDSNRDYAFYVEIRGNVYSKSELLGIGLYDGEKGYFISPSEIDEYKDIFKSSSNKYTYDQKKNIVVLNSYNINFNNVNFDTLIGLYLLDYVVKDDISFVAKNFDYNIELYEDTYGTEKRPKDVPLERIRELAISKAKFIYETKNKIEEIIKSEDMEYLFKSIEMPLSIVLADMELTGIKLDVDYLTKVQEELKVKMDNVEKEIYSLAGSEFNIMSPIQLAKVLFEDLMIPYPKRVKDGKYSTSKDILDKLVDTYPIVNKVLEYRTLSKLYTNYAVGLIDEVRSDGRIHTIYNQALTRTGRLSSIEPNLQNIPARGEYSSIIRKAFIPDEDSVLLGSDYSQVELRVFASLSNTENLIEAFKNDQDIHTKTASDIFGVPMEEVTKDMRRTAKAVNFGIVYGISSFGLADDLGIDFRDAKKFIDNYLATYPGIVDFMEELKNNAYRDGYVKTLMGRKRVIEELSSKNYMIRQGGERMALNTPIQGTAADILKKAMVEIYDEFNKRGLKSKMLLQVHDELVFNVVKEELDEVKGIVKNIMENTYQLKVPLKVDIEYGKDWSEAK
ncbi:MAG: DNA polymerase I [Bacilli bacterium]|nr:DNA polymerase I [Bacilli bacterium]